MTGIIWITEPYTLLLGEFKALDIYVLSGAAAEIRLRQHFTTNPVLK